ncbi:MAG: tetratricopeptide repeat protein [Candidatus Midichloria sp.]|uniref:Tetratricopeptide repeat protein n=1 Tax=Hyalomma marginatum TaxID=34627 RepID=A0A8S4C3T1_9ACAR|nr:tetratricopeptide repeat protein [Hyalomma marginatum]CAG7598616.1 tetratricopeptide repeat protein [Hyalomma marginatum]
MALLYEAQNKPAESLVLYEKSLANMHIFGEDSKNVADVYNNMAILSKDQHNYEKASAIYRSVFGKK